jgi:hypothetical protein
MIHRFSLTKLTSKATKGGGLVLAVAAAAVIGGATTAFVMAAIPGSDGTISACYNTKSGALKVIDAEAGKTCNSKQTPLNWSAVSGAVAVHDANGQFLGNLVDYGNGDTTVYNPTLNRTIQMTGSDTGPSKLTVSPGFDAVLYYTSTDCTGQAYIANTADAKTQVVRWYLGGSESYGTASDNATASNVTVQSELDYLGSFDDNFSCSSGDDFTGSYYPATTVTLPFTVPAQGPLQF